ncbi:Orange carotenoid protein [Thermosynechococcus sp. B0]|uniref:orange carotenoid protein N-terminal domain-containing protein n=1 Tax=unclassified Thermosynechococcus TaxID=2622553 RepID=UPI0025787078|nr:MULTISPECIES: orange carotenoid protein N-terminal domain-containing protein [unclassified Thermosynechococcus]WJI23663.1 Orange carotenoid protein [Thermosynechococcus sp. B0]WJI26175.1 Orange carotenoid protein [Thermosynechococcus sp. B1]WJI28700.1 Orange carotenoid protein [Thermosynechococcus sp. B3]WKT83295.1 orange carotenoid protein N-terminal domain-containing protein [Thermosynechococcus sp. HY596]WNC62424.1 orange carotenoid protein N-terminal domain-containing protein [Thermosyn
MTYTTDTRFNPTTLATAVQEVTTLFNCLSVDDKLGLLWFIYTETGRSITAAAPGTARLQLAEGLLNQVKALSFDDQLQFMRDLVANVDTPLTRAYGVFSPNTKLAFWYQLAELMKQGFVVPVPPGYTLSRDADRVFAAIKALDFGQQITVLRNAVVAMGVDPLAV